jgi:hypothetical protein
MEAILQTLCDLEGVNGAVVADDRGQIIACRSHAVYDATILYEMSRAIATAVDSIKLLHEHWESVAAHFVEGTLLIRSIPAASRGKAPQCTLSVIADSRLNHSFAGVAVRVAVSKLKTLLETGAPAPMLAAPAAIGRPSSAGLAAALPVATGGTQARASIPDVTNGGLSWSGFGASAVSGSGIAAVDGASAAVLQSCTKALARSVGPIAKRYVKEVVNRLWPERPFSKEQAPLLVAELEAYLIDPAHVAEFRRAALKPPT